MTYLPRHAFPYSAVYDSDREYDGHIPSHRAAAPRMWDVFDVRDGRPLWTSRFELAARVMARRGAWLDYAPAGVGYQH